MGLSKGAFFVLLALVSAALAVDRFNTCSFATRDRFSGVYVGGNSPVTITIGWEGVVTEISQSSIYDARWTYNGTHLFLNYVTSAPADPSLCTAQGIYLLNWSFKPESQCGSVAFAAVQDPCTNRLSKYNGLLLNRVLSTCKFRPLDWWRGVYPGSVSPLAGLQVQFQLGTKTDVNETSSRGLIRVDWAIDPRSRSLLTRDVSANPPNLACVRGPDERAIYALTWSRNCTAIYFRYVDNDCSQRRDNYDTLFITRAKDNTPQCRFYSGDTWRGRYSSVHPQFSNLPFTVAVGENDRVTETNSFAYRDSVWSIDSKGDLNIRDIFASPFNFSCGPATGKYYLDWNQDCSRVTLTNILEGCDGRRQLLNTVTLAKDISTCKFYPGQVWEGVYPGRDPTRSGAAVSLSFGQNLTVQENFTTLDVAGTVDGRWQITRGGILDIRWFASNPSSSCAPDAEALYIIQWSKECSVAQLRVINDDCPSRQNLYNGFVIKKDVSQCLLLPGDSYFGTFPGGGLKGGKTANVTLTAVNQVTVQTTITSQSSSWSFNDAGNLVVQDTSGNDICPANQRGVYSAVWSADCQTLSLFLINDPCGGRASNLNGLVLVRGVPRTLTCRTLPGDSWRGVYQGNDTTFSGRSVTLTFGSDVNAVELSSAASFAVSWYINGSSILSAADVPELSADPSVTCGAGCKPYALYRVQWSNDCTRLSLTLISDTCSRRAQTYNGLVLNRVNSQCNFYPNEEWRGVYATGAGALSGQGVIVRFGATQNQLTESTDGFSWQNSWSLNANSQVSARTFGSAPPQQTCSASAEGIYAPVWSNDCNTLTLYTVFDTCADRAGRYEKLVLNREIETGPACGFRQGDIFEGNFSLSARAPFTGATVRVQFTESTSVFESTATQTKTSRMFVDQRGLLTVRDISSRPSTIYACDSSLSAQYILKWSWDCNTVEFRANFDPCERRRNRMDGQVLKRVASTCRALPGTVWDGVVVSGKFAGKVLNATVGTSKSVILGLPSGYIRTRWNFDNNGFLNVIDDKSANCLDACNPAVNGLYSALFSEDCNKLTLNLINDVCSGRSQYLDQVVLYKRKRTTGAQAEVFGYETETEVQFNFGGMLPPQPCCLASSLPGCGCSSSSSSTPCTAQSVLDGPSSLPSCGCGK